MDLHWEKANVADHHILKGDASTYQRAATKETSEPPTPE